MNYLENLYFGASKKIIEQARELRKNQTPEEKLLWNCLTKRGDGYRFRRQHPIASFIVDIYCHEKKLVIEVDGGIHKIPENKENDQGRTDELNKYGIRVIRYTNEDIINRLEAVVADILRILEE